MLQLGSRGMPLFVRGVTTTALKRTRLHPTSSIITSPLPHACLSVTVCVCVLTPAVLTPAMFEPAVLTPSR